MELKRELQLRRCLMIAALVIAIMPGVGSLAAAAQQANAEAAFATVKIADGIYAFIPGERLDEVDGNSMLIIGGDTAVVVDTNTSPANARVVLAAVRRLTDKPVAFVVNTHWHYDHLLGNQVYKAAFPGTQIVAHEETARIGQTWAQYYPARATEALAASRTALEQQVSSGKNATGAKLTPLETRLAVAQLRGFEAFRQKVTEARYLLPDVTFRDRVTLDLGGRVVQVLNFGRGNTPGDAVVYVPDARVLATGDLVVHPTPFGLLSYPASWIGVMKRLMEIDAQSIVPGHGPVLRDRTYLAAVTDLLTSVVDQVRACVARNMTLDQTRTAVDLERFRKQLAGGDELRNWMFQTYWVAPIVERAWREARGEF